MVPMDASAPPSRATIRTVAEDVGVSVAAMSKVLRGTYGVSDGLRARVNASIDRLGYRPSKAAQGLRGRSTTVGVLLVEISNPFLPQVIDGMQDVLAPSRFQAMIGVGRAQTHLETGLIESMIDHGMAGVILVAPHLPPDTVARYACRIPTVLVACHEPGSTVFDTVNGDDAGADRAGAPRRGLPRAPQRGAPQGRRGGRARGGLPAGDRGRGPRAAGD